MGELRIELAKPTDLNQFVDMHEEVRDWLEARGLTPLPREIHRESAEYYGESISKKEVYLAYVGREMVGAFRLLPEDEIVWPGATADALYLHSLIVLRAWSRRGFGREMLAWSEKQVRPAGKTFLRLDCFASNSFLRKYYESAGYSARGEIDAEYPFATLRLARFEKRCQAGDN